jgi:hypothetical protein
MEVLRGCQRYRESGEQPEVVKWPKRAVEATGHPTGRAGEYVETGDVADETGEQVFGTGDGAQYEVVADRDVERGQAEAELWHGKDS